ncbi:MAG: hypothetical protein HY815_13355 [Candidatus Riflebacteria bacterium]|nr:hypothetical protein [Candidatus Riflebacteria bacterium]
MHLSPVVATGYRTDAERTKNGEAFDRLGRACPCHEPSLSECLRIEGVRALRRWCRSQPMTASGLTIDPFRIDLQTWRETVEDDGGGDPLDGPVLASALEQLESAFRLVNATLFSDGVGRCHHISDCEHDHGFIRTPWTLVVGSTHAAVLVMRGTWY